MQPRKTEHALTETHTTLRSLTDIHLSTQVANIVLLLLLSRCMGVQPSGTRINHGRNVFPESSGTPTPHRWARRHPHRPACGGPGPEAHVRVHRARTPSPDGAPPL